MSDGLVIKKLVDFIQSRVTLLDDGLTMVVLSTKELQATKEFILLIHQTLLHLTPIYSMETNKTIYILEFLLQNKRMIWLDKQPFFKLNIQIISLLKTLVQDSIINEKGFLDSWNYLVKDLLMKWSSIAKTGFADSDLNLSNGYSCNTIQNSWFLNKLINLQNKNSLRTFCLFYKFLLVVGTEKENTPLIRTRKYRLKLNSLQKSKLNEYSYHYKWCYNKSIGLLNDEYYSKYELRNLIVPEEVNCRNPWIIRTGFQIRANACFEAHQALKTNINLVKQGDKKFFNLKYKRKKTLGWTINISKENIKQVNDKEFGLYERTMGRINTTEKIPKIEKDCKIQFDGEHYYIIIPIDIEKKKTVSKEWFCSLDPGVRKFQTVYNPEKEEINYIGDRASTRIYKKILKLDKTTKKKEIIKLRNQIKNLQKELHDKTSRYLCNSFNNIYIPKLNKDNDIIKKHVLHKKTTRNMVLLGHCKFVEKLKTKADEYNDVKILIITEEYTSQTCINCKKRTKTSNEMFECGFCGYTIDRDMLGSINIFEKQYWLDTTNADMRSFITLDADNLIDYRKVFNNV